MGVREPWPYDYPPPCAELDAEIFFPVNNRIPKLDRKVIGDTCASCPAREQCAAYATEHKEDGWWGGTGPEERQARRRRAAGG